MTIPGKARVPSNASRVPSANMYNAITGPMSKRPLFTGGTGNVAALRTMSATPNAADGIARRCTGAVFNFAGKTTLGELAALVSLSKLHLGVDSEYRRIGDSGCCVRGARGPELRGLLGVRMFQTAD